MQIRPVQRKELELLEVKALKRGPVDAQGQEEGP